MWLEGRGGSSAFQTLRYDETGSKKESYRMVQGQAGQFDGMESFGLILCLDEDLKDSVVGRNPLEQSALWIGDVWKQEEDFLVQEYL
jgi:hypothetical protein